jgi:rhodanese-related sulfurtransferase
MRGAATALVTVVLALVAAGAAGAQGPNVYQTTLEEANQKTPEVSTDELKRILANGSAVVLDTRPHLEYAMSHIPGARNVAPKAGVSMSMYVSDVAEVQRLVGGDKTRALILYCNGPSAARVSG